MEHDSSYKKLFSNPEMVHDLFVGFVDEPWVADIDFGVVQWPCKMVGEKVYNRLDWRSAARFARLGSTDAVFFAGNWRGG